MGHKSTIQIPVGTHQEAAAQSGFIRVCVKNYQAFKLLFTDFICWLSFFPNELGQSIQWWLSFPKFVIASLLLLIKILLFCLFDFSGLGACRDHHRVVPRQIYCPWIWPTANAGVFFHYIQPHLMPEWVIVCISMHSEAMLEPGSGSLEIFSALQNLEPAWFLLCKGRKPNLVHFFVLKYI